ncbi:hypothetical protein SETIT_3G324300v2 [Setaria italica]|uniref:Uncharacterized protein n=1 Tax=Setaria italica TaxID=4555 RepID=A0A368QLA0_SETIT|nr:hypothetical protein SETIT_3G324300v2 [Setaria italica]
MIRFCLMTLFHPLRSPRLNFLLGSARGPRPTSSGRSPPQCQAPLRIGARAPPLCWLPLILLALLDHHGHHLDLGSHLLDANAMQPSHCLVLSCGGSALQGGGS